MPINIIQYYYKLYTIYIDDDNYQNKDVILLFNKFKHQYLTHYANICRNKTCNCSKGSSTP